jgi:hypothetical protein
MADSTVRGEGLCRRNGDPLAQQFQLDRANKAGT